VDERDQVEELQRWWKENGRVVVLGLVVGLGGVLGWTSWQSHQANQAEQGLPALHPADRGRGEGRDEQALGQAQRLMEDYPRSGYAVLGALVGARIAVATERAEDARRQLAWVLDRRTGQELQDLARVRLARLHLEEERFADGLALLDGIASPGFDEVVAELRADLLLARGDREAARAEYERVLAAEELAPGTRSRIRMKLDDLGHLRVP
jgi:predicted negative regulator of RcsB-dependent stress response